MESKNVVVFTKVIITVALAGLADVKHGGSYQSRAVAPPALSTKVASQHEASSCIHGRR